MPQPISELPRTLGELRTSAFPEDRLARRTVKDELRANLICKLQRRDELFPGIVGYEDSVVPQMVNAILSRHNFILLGLRGQAKTRLIRMLTTLFDPWLPYIAGCEIHDNPYSPICRRCKLLIAEKGDVAPIAWLSANSSYQSLAVTDELLSEATQSLNLRDGFHVGRFRGHRLNAGVQRREPRSVVFREAAGAQRESKTRAQCQPSGSGRKRHSHP